MATKTRAATRTKRAGGSKPYRPTYASPGRPQPAPTQPPEKPPEPALPETEEGLMAALTAICDRFGREMDAPRPDWLAVAYPPSYPANKWSDMRAQSRQLTEALGKLVSDERLGNQTVYEMIRKELATPPGEVPHWSRPGTFLLWVGFVPLRCSWRGPLEGTAVIDAADPTSLFPSPHGSLTGPSRVGDTVKTVEAWFRLHIAMATDHYTTEQRGRGAAKRAPSFNLHRLQPDARTEAAAYLAANPWLQAALKRGPVDPIPLPKHLEAVQLPL